MAASSGPLSLRQWWQRRSLRVRLTTVTVVTLTVTLGAGGVLLAYFSERAMIAGAERSARLRATNLALEPGRIQQLGRQTNQPALANGSPRTARLTKVLVDSHGLVLIASQDSAQPILDKEQLRRVRAGEAVLSKTRGVGPALAVGQRKAGDDRSTVIVATPIGDVLHSVQVMRRSLFIGVPLVIALLGLAVWFVVGSALRPVAALRRGARRIADSGQGHRLPEPVSRDEIHDLAVTLNGMLDRLAAASARQRSFTADAAHELRSPLAAVRTQLEVALAHPRGQNWSETASEVLLDVQRLSRLTEGLLALSRLDDTGASPSDDAARLVDLRELVTTTVERYRSARAVVRWSGGDPPGGRAGEEVVVRAVPGDLDRVLTNLVDNAVRHASSEVRVAAQVDPRHAMLVVTDDGPGIDEADRDRVFERFTRLDDARDRDAGGAGLGLDIVAETVKRYRGEVSLADAGPGLRVTVRLPRHGS